MKAAESQTLAQNPTTNGHPPSKSPKKQKISKIKKQKTEEIPMEKEGSFLLGEPTFKKLPGGSSGGGRWRCVETGQEMPEKEKEAYSKSRACRIGLIDSFVAKKMPPLNAFEPHPMNKRQLICKITGDSVNKTEEHIWKHLNGIRFNNKLAELERESALTPEEVLKEEEERKAREEKKKKRNPVNKKVRALEAKKKEEGEMLHQQEEAKKEEKKARKEEKKKKKLKEREEAEMEIETEGKEEKKASKEEKKSKKEKKKNKKKETDEEEEETEFWMPPVGERWDFDDGKDENGDEEEDTESGELTTRAKRMSIAVGPSSHASRKKKMKAASKSDAN